MYKWEEIRISWEPWNHYNKSLQECHDKLWIPLSTTSSDPSRGRQTKDLTNCSKILDKRENLNSKLYLPNEGRENRSNRGKRRGRCLFRKNVELRRTIIRVKHTPVRHKVLPYTEVSGCPKVDELQPTLVGHNQIGWLHIPVHYSCCMHFVQGGDNLPHDLFDDRWASSHRVITLQCPPKQRFLEVSWKILLLHEV